MLVIDASVLVTVLVDDDEDGVVARQRLFGNELRAPAIVDLEVLSALRHLVARGDVPVRRAEIAVRDLSAFPVERVDHRPHLARCWELRNNVTMYDAIYVALAEATRSTLVTSDARLAHATGPRCSIEVVTLKR